MACRRAKTEGQAEGDRLAEITKVGNRYYYGERECLSADEAYCRFRYGRIRARLLGIVGIAYCRMIGLWDQPDIDEEEYDDWLDWLLGYNSRVLYLVGIKQKAGRTNKRLKKRYR